MKQSRLVTLGLILVAVPVVFQCAMIFAMVKTLWSIESDYFTAAESRNRLNRLDDCTMRIVEGLYVLVPGRSGAAHNEAHAEMQILNAKKEFRDLEREISAALATVDTGDNTELVNKAKRDLVRILKTIYWAVDQTRVIDTTEGRMVLAPKINAAATPFLDDIHSLVDLEKARRSQFANLSPHDYHRIQSWLTLSICVSVGVTILMAIFFVTRIKAPLNRIAKNLSHMAEHKPLLPPSASKDELGTLDRLIHSVASETNRALAREQAIVKEARDVICSLDEDATFLTANPAALTMLAIGPAALVGKKLNELTAGADSFAADEVVRKAISSNDFQIAELTLMRGDHKPIDTRWSCLWSDQESSLFCVVHDITREKELAQMKQDFLNMISHDLRSPLTSVIGGLTLLSAGAKGEVPAAIKEEAQSAIESAKKLVDFIGDLLDFQKLDAGQMPLDLKSHSALDLVNEAVALVDALAKDRSIEISYDVERLRFNVVCDRQKIIQIIVNLLSNGIKFSPANSTINITVEQDNEATRFAISDSGPGVPENMRVRIFEPFEQLPSTRDQGTGLGLAICKMIVEAHKGTIGISDLTRGSEFWFKIPRS